MGFELIFPSREENVANYGPSTSLTVWAEACCFKLKESASLHPQGSGKKNQGRISRWGTDSAELLRGPAAELWHLGQPWRCSVSPLLKPRHTTLTAELSWIPRWGKDRGHMPPLEKKTPYSSILWGTLSFRVFCNITSVAKDSPGTPKLTHNFFSEGKVEWPENAWGLTKAFSILSLVLGCHRDLLVLPLQTNLIIPGEDCWRQGIPRTCRLNPPRWQSVVQRHVCMEIWTYFKLIYFIIVPFISLVNHLDNS